jgi:pyrroloquinoline quinone biosynthesis protein B
MINTLTFKLLPMCLGVLYLNISCKAQSHDGYDEIRPYVIVLGTVQDGGSPHIGCAKSCCVDLFKNPDPNRKVVSLGIVDPENKKYWILDATPDFISQVNYLNKKTSFVHKPLPDGIFLTHAHIGHYTGLMYLGREASGADNVSVYAMPRMKKFLEENGPWSQLVDLKNIKLVAIANETTVVLSKNISITPILVPHRDEFSETVGFKIEGPEKSLLFIPDIDKWQKWKLDIVEEIKNADYALLDATFYSPDELNNRDMSEIPHPFVVESMELFEPMELIQKQKVHFIHFNHTNPLLIDGADSQNVIKRGYHLSRYGQVFKM